MSEQDTTTSQREAYLALEKAAGEAASAAMRGRRKGRPKKQEGEYRCLDVRLTPDSAAPIEFKTKINPEDFRKFLAYEEGGEFTDKKLHYHLYLETLRSDTWLNTLWRSLTGGTGNKFFSTRIAHNGTEGYAVKDEKPAHIVGYTPVEIQDIIQKSRDYRKETSTTQKRESRAKNKFLTDVLQKIREDTKDSSPTSREIISRILAAYSAANRQFPPRGTLENATLSILYEYKPEMVINFYTSNLTFHTC